MPIKPEDLARMSGLTGRILSMIAVFDMASAPNPAMANNALHEAVLASRELRQLAGGLDNTNPPSLALVETPEVEPLDEPEPPEGPTEPTPPEPASA